MILVSVGTQLPFDRLVTAVDAWAGETGRTDVLAQIGPMAIRPKHIHAVEFLSPDRLRELQSGADLLIAHCGMGSILSALELGQPIIVMPRRQELGEHRNDHQLATARRARDLPGVEVAMDEAELHRLLLRIDGISRATPIAAKAPRAFTDRLAQFIATGRS